MQETESNRQVSSNLSNHRVAAGAVAAFLFVLALASQSPSFCKNSHVLISYRIQVNATDLSGFDVEMRIRGTADKVRIAMASHSEYDDRYWRYVESLRAESRGATLPVTREENVVWRIDAPDGDLTVKYRIRLPPQTTPTRAAWRPFLSKTGGLVGDVHSLMYVVGATSSPARVTLELPAGWAIASGLEPTRDAQTFAASSVELLLDSPIIVGQFRHWDFSVNGVQHQVVYFPEFYFSDVLVRRAKLPIYDPTRLAYLERNIAAYLGSPSYSRISAERVSRANGNPVGLGDDYASTHLQGNVLGTMLDLMIRESTSGRRSLADVIRRLSDRFSPQRGITGREIETAVREVCNCDPQPFFDAYVRGAAPIDFDQYLRAIGLRTQVSWSPAIGNDGKLHPDLRVFAFGEPGESPLRLRLANPASAWGRAGLHTGDRVVSLDGHSIATTADFRSWLGKLHIGDSVRVAVARDGVVSNIDVVVTGYDRPTVKIVEIANATPTQRRLRMQWVTGQRSGQQRSMAKK